MLAAAVWTDLRTRKVPNSLILLFTAVAVVSIPAINGWAGFLDASLSAMTAMVCMLPLYLMRALGGGDLKIFVVASLLMSWKVTFLSLLASLVWGALLGVTMVLTRQEWKSFATNMTSLALRNSVQKESLHKIPYTAALLFGFLSALLMERIL